MYLNNPFRELDLCLISESHPYLKIGIKRKDACGLTNSPQMFMTLPTQTIRLGRSNGICSPRHFLESHGVMDVFLKAISFNINSSLPNLQY